MISLTLRSLWGRKRRLVGTAAAIVFGVGFLAATLVLGDTLDHSFRGHYAQANAGTDVIVRGATGVETDEGVFREPLPASIADRVASVPGVEATAVGYRGTAQVLDADGRPIGGQGPPTEGANWVDDAELNPYRLTDGRAPAEADEVVVDHISAATAGLAVGDQATILTPEPVTATVVGLVRFGDQPTLLGATYVGFTEAVAAERFAAPGTFTDVRVRGDETTTDAELATAVARALGPEAEAITGAELTAQQQARIEADFLGFVKTALVAFAGVALVVATFSIFNTFTILVAQRSREVALLRAVGASRAQVLRGVLLEAVAIGAAASVVGLGVGLALALGLKELVSMLGLDLPGTGLAVEPRALLTAAAVGLGATAVAGLVPAIRAGRTAPVEAMRDASSTAGATSRARAAVGFALAGTGLAVVLTATGTPDAAFARAGLGSLAVVAGIVVLGPTIARPAAGLLGAPVATLRPQTGRLARRNAMRNPRRTSASALALVIGTTVVALFATFGASLRTSIDRTVDQSFGGDLVLTPDGFSGVGLPEALVPAIGELDEVDHVVALEEALITVDGRLDGATAAEPEALAALVDLDVREGSVAALAPGQLAITDAYATEQGLEPGDPLTVELPDGTTDTATVGAVFGVRELLGDVIVPAEDWAPHRPEPGVAAILVGLRDGVDLEAGRSAVQATTDRFGGPTVMDRDQYVDNVAGEIDTLLTLIYVLLVLAVLIALIGLANTLSLSTYERTRELGMLRAVGLTQGGVRATVRWESVITAVLGAGVGMGLGTFLGWGLIRALAAQEGFISFRAPTATLVVVLAGAAVAGVAAAVRPARQAARTDLVAALGAS